MLNFIEDGRTHKRRSPMDSYMESSKTYIHLICRDIGCRLGDLPRVITDRDIWYVCE